jgi:demethylmenaquinone methyltransferase/2-methoxy-6-polyprenyl-1,4-benzoquinol methylase
MQPRPTRGDDLDALLAEQISYYSARAPEYFRGAIAVDPADATAARQELLAAIAAFNPRGDVLELACGPGTWTAEILRYADSITAVDASPEMLALAAAAVGKHGAEVRFVNADLFSWEPDRLYDAVFFGFWLSHVPVERFASFWAMVAAAGRTRDVRRRRVPRGRRADRRTRVLDDSPPARGRHAVPGGQSPLHPGRP